MTLLNVTGISKKGENNFSLKGISFSQRRHQKIAIAGETGSGKSTLLKIVAGLVQPDVGKIQFENGKVKGPAENLVPGHPGISYLSQDFELPKFLRVEQVLAYANTLSSEESNTLYEVCQIDHLLTRKTDQLSGGERQRIAIARLLISWPRLLLLDEPFTHLDMVHKNTLKTVIHNIGKRLKITCVLVSHDPEDTLSWADMILVMHNGRIVQKGTPEKIYSQPVNDYVAGLFGKFNTISPVQASTLRKILRIKPGRGKKQMMIRPEYFKLTSKKRNTLSGKVKQVDFFGSYYEIEVSLTESTIILKTEKDGIAVGKRVYVSVSSDGVWYI